MTTSAKTLRARTLKCLERAAMRWFKVSGGFFFGEGNIVHNHLLARRLENACAAHAAALKRKRTGRR